MVNGHPATWDKISLDTIRNSIGQWKRRLNTVVQAAGGAFAHMFQYLKHWQKRNFFISMCIGTNNMKSYWPIWIKFTTHALNCMLNPRPGGGLSHLRHGGGGKMTPPPLTRKLGKLEGRSIRRSTALSEPVRSHFSIFSLRWILRSAEVIKGQIFEKWWFYQECRPLSREL